MSIAQRIGRGPLSRLLPLLLALAVVLAGGLAGAPRASADTPYGRISHITFTLTGTSQGQANAYRQLIQDVHAAATTPMAQNLDRTQDQVAALIRVDIQVAEVAQTLTLWIRPDNLYLAGFTSNDGTTYGFNDFPLQGALTILQHGTDRNLVPDLTRSYTLPYNSSYAALRGNGNRTLAETPLAYPSAIESARALLHPNNDNQAVARALTFFIQFIPEATRFRAMNETMYNVMRGGSEPGVPEAIEAVELDWRSLSRLAAARQNGTPINDVTIGGQTFHSLQDVIRVMAVALGPLNRAAASGDLDHSQL